MKETKFVRAVGCLAEYASVWLVGGSVVWLWAFDLWDRPETRFEHFLWGISLATVSLFIAAVAVIALRGRKD